METDMLILLCFLQTIFWGHSVEPSITRFYKCKSPSIPKADGESVGPEGTSGTHSFAQFLILSKALRRRRSCNTQITTFFPHEVTSWSRSWAMHYSPAPRLHSNYIHFTFSSLAWLLVLRHSSLGFSRLCFWCPWWAGADRAVASVRVAINILSCAQVEGRWEGSVDLGMSITCIDRALYT